LRGEGEAVTVYAAGPFKCRMPGCCDREYHWHSRASLHDEIDRLTAMAMGAEALREKVRVLQARINDLEGRK